MVNDAPLAIDYAYTMAADTLLTVATPGVLGTILTWIAMLLNAGVCDQSAHGLLTLNPTVFVQLSPGHDYKRVVHVHLSGH